MLKKTLSCDAGGRPQYKPCDSALYQCNARVNATTCDDFHTGYAGAVG